MDGHWQGFKGLRTIAVAIAFLAGDALADVPSADPLPINLGTDDIYRRDGALVDMKTCLDVAGNANALELLDSQPFEKVKSWRGFGLARHLDEMDLFWRHAFGFGTIRACAEIVDAWYGRPRTYALPDDDGRLLHGAIVIDLATDRPKSGGTSGSSAQYGLIDALALVRILNAPFLLPRSSFGGIVIRHARLEGALLFHNLQLSVPLAFVDVEFRGNDYNKFVFGQNDPVEDAALTIAFSDFQGSLLIARSSVCGNIRVIDSRFSESVRLDTLEQKSLDCRPLSDFVKLEAAPPTLRIETSFFDQSLEIMRSTFGHATIFGSDINRLNSDKSRFGNSAEIVANDIELLQIRCSVFAERTQISRNRIDKQLLIEGIDTVRNRQGEVRDTACHDWWQVSGWYRSETTTQLTIDDNVIEGRLSLDRFQGSDVESPLLLINNRVSGASRVVLPSPDSKGGLWPGGVSFGGSTYHGNLEIRHSPPEAGTEEANLAQRRYCRVTPDKGHSTWTTIHFNVTHIRTLIWNLPLYCDYRWHGHGLTYDLWMSGDFAKHSLTSTVANMNKIDLDHLALMNWRTALTRYDPSPLITLSEYLSGNGQYVESRRVLHEAKRLNYAPDCRPDDPIWKCLGQLMIGDGDSGAHAAETAGQPDRETSASSTETSTQSALVTWFQDVTAELTRFSMLILLWPGGYGASPEFAIVLLVSLFFLCWFVYHRYALRMRQLLIDEWSHIDRFLGGRDDPAATPKSAMTDRSGLEEVQDAFHLEDLSTTDLCTSWISRKTWVEEMSDEERLSEIQGPLLNRIKAVEAQSSGSDQKIYQEFRQRLARFGNTEIAGFDRFDSNKMPRRFTVQLYAFDTMIPVIDLHAYSNYYPISKRMRMLSILQHVFGWWWVTVFIASAAIL